MIHPKFTESQAKVNTKKHNEQKDTLRLGKLVITALLPIPFFYF